MKDDFLAKQQGKENVIKAKNFFTKTCKFTILHVAIYFKSENKTKILQHKWKLNELLADSHYKKC